MLHNQRIGSGAPDGVAKATTWHVCKQSTAGCTQHRVQESLEPGTPVVLTRKQRVVACLVDADEQYAVILLKDVLCAVAVVHVKVDNGHPLQLVLAERVQRCYCHVVEQAVAATHGWLCVVPWRPGSRDTGYDKQVACNVARTGRHNTLV